MSTVERIRKMLAKCSLEEKREILRHLREGIELHPLESQLGTKAEIILEAIQRGSSLTLQMIRGVIAEAAFGVEIVEKLSGWERVSMTGSPSYDFHLRDGQGDVRVQVKLQRSKDNRPMRASEALRSLSEGMFVVETRRTRTGTRSGQPTRHYRFGEFDVLAVAMYPSVGRWDCFLCTVARWLLPASGDAGQILKFQPVPPAANEDWTDDFLTAVQWFRSAQRKTIGGIRANGN